MLQIGICDDMESDRSDLRMVLCSLPGYRRAGDLCFHEYESAEQLLFHIEGGGDKLDLLFLDIYMSGLTGIEAARELRELGMKKPIVFLTTSPDFALESYDVDAMGYLLKPAKPEKLERILEKMLTNLEKPRLAVKCAGRRQYCAFDELLYLESSNNITLLHLVDGQVLQCGVRLSALEKELSDRRFLRCHQSYLVNMDYVRGVEDYFVMYSNERVPIRVRSRREITDAYYNYFVENSITKLPEMEESYV